MPLTYTELGISSDTWNDLISSNQGAGFNVTFYEWEPNFDTIVDTLQDFADFDAINFDDAIYRINYYSAQILSNTITPVTGFTPASSTVTGSPPSLAVDDSTLFVFSPTTSGISMNTYDGSWSGNSSILSDSTVKFIAATAWDTVHFITYNTSQHYYRFHVAKYSGSWTVTDSDIYWGYIIGSFAAKRINGVDILAITSDSPGVQSVRVIGTQVVKSIIPSGGLFIFTYKYGTWSDHRVVDNIDQWSAFRYRSKVRMTVIDNTLWMTCYSSEGTIDHPITSYRFYSSKDGTHWSGGKVIEFPNDSISGILLLGLDDALFAVTYRQYFIAKRTLQFGSPHEDTIYDATPRVMNISVSRKDIQQIQLSLDDRRSLLEDTILSGNSTLALILQTGYGEVLVQTGIFEIDTLEPSKDAPKKALDLVARDRMAWLVTKSQSEQFLNWTPQAIGVDEYIDTTGTGYGGLTHTAPTEGSFLAADGALQLSSNNEEGLAYSTWLFDNWNGSVESFITLATLGNSEYIGLAFRSPDKDNGYFLRYDQDLDKLELDLRVGGTPSIIWQSGTKGWSGSLTGHFLRIEYYYNHLYIYLSDAASGAGVDWSLEDDLIIDGETDISNPLIQSGYVGSYGRGFSDLSSSFPEAGLIPEGDLPDSYDPYEPTPPLVPPTTPAPDAEFDYEVGRSRDVWFFDRSTFSGGSIVSWYWDFGDGNNSTSQNPQHTYADNTTRNVQLTITTDDAQNDSTSKSIHPGTASTWTHTSDFTSLDTLDDGWVALTGRGVFASGIGWTLDPAIYYNFPIPATIYDFEITYYHNHVSGSELVQRGFQVFDGVATPSYNPLTDYAESFGGSDHYSTSGSHFTQAVGWTHTDEDGVVAIIESTASSNETITKITLAGTGHNPFEV